MKISARIMKTNPSVSSIVLLLLLLFCGCAENDDFPVLRGDYLGQNPPGESPEIFAPGIISLGFHEHHLTISPDGD